MEPKLQMKTGSGGMNQKLRKRNASTHHNIVSGSILIMICEQYY